VPSFKAAGNILSGGGSANSSFKSKPNIAVALLGAITHQTLATCAPPRVKPLSFSGRFRAVPGAGFTNAIVILYLISWLLGAVVYLYFKVDVQPNFERDRHLHGLGFLISRRISRPSAWVCCPHTGSAGVGPLAAREG
jgi:hypothetical protein